MVIAFPILAVLLGLWLLRHRLAIVAANRRKAELQRHADHIWALEREMGWEPWGVFGLEPPKPKADSFIVPRYLPLSFDKEAPARSYTPASAGSQTVVVHDAERSPRHSVGGFVASTDVRELVGRK